MASAGARSDLERLAESYVALGQVESAEQMNAAIDGISDEELDRIYGEASGQLNQLIAMNLDLAAGRGVTHSSSLGSVRSAGLPQPNFSATCPESSEVSYDDLLAARIVLTVAQGVWTGLSRLCNQVAVAIGVGANTSSACIPADIILFAAEETFEFIELCNDDIAGRRADAVLARTGHIHGDIEDVDGDLAAHDADIKLILATLEAKIDLLQGAVDLLGKTQLEQMAHLLGGARAGVMYTDRLVELCDAAQEAIDDATALNYVVSPSLQAKVTQGIALIASDPKAAHDLCRDAYKKSTRGSARLQ
jgi:hypothetical protein